jgi:hypothetical protein
MVKTKVVEITALAIVKLSIIMMFLLSDILFKETTGFTNEPGVSAHEALLLTFFYL